jgi:hypothetical protein
MSDIATDKPRARSGTTAISQAHYAVTQGPYGESILPYQEDLDYDDYEMTEGEISRAIDRGLPLQCTDCDREITIDEPGWWTRKGMGEVVVCSTCHHRNEMEVRDDNTKHTSLHEIPDHTTIWVSDIAEAITLPMVTLLDAVEADYRNLLIEHIRQELDEYDDRGFRKGPLDR